MKHQIRNYIIVLFTLYVIPVIGQNTVGLTNYGSGNTDGYVLFSPITSTNTYLINKCGEKVHEWNTSAYQPALSSFLLEDGSLLRTGQLNNPAFNEGGSGGIIEKFDWNGNLTWSYSISNSLNCLHHDFKVMPNGNILCIVWDSYTKQQAVDNGKDPAYNQTTLWSEKIIELKPLGIDSAEIVWEWKLFDHLIQDFDDTQLNFGVVADHPELVDINYFPGAQNTPDWIHLNSIDYNPELDQILVSSHRMCEVWVIDHSTTTLEAAGHGGGISGRGGDLLYRWGNPQAYKRGGPSTKVFFGQHHATWIPSGFPNENKILVFNNGLGRPGTYSSIDIIIPPLNASNNYDLSSPTTAYLPNGLDWSYIANTPTDFYSSNISGVYPLDNGSFLITSGAGGEFFEITATQQNQWEYINPVSASGIAAQGDVPTANPVFRCEFYSPNYPGLQGQVLDPLGEIELNPAEPSICDLLSYSQELIEVEPIQVYPNPFSDQFNVRINDQEPVIFTLYNTQGKALLVKELTNDAAIEPSSLKPGIYLYTISNDNGLHSEGKLVKAY